jgi:hypothetical protein
MRKLLGIFAAGLLTLGIAGQAHAIALGFTGTFTLQVATLLTSVPGAGTAIANGSGGPGHLSGLNLAGGEFATTGFVLPVTDPAVSPIRGIQVTVANGIGNFAGVGGAGFGGVMPLEGVAKVCLFGACNATGAPMTTYFPGDPFPGANISVPLNVIGAGGVAAVGALVNVTVIGAPWTTGTAAVGTITAMGGVSPLSNTGAASGNVTLVTPVFISTNIPSSSVVPSFGILQLHFVPEPGTLVLLGSGVAGLVAFGRSRRS